VRRSRQRAQPRTAAIRGRRRHKSSEANFPAGYLGTSPSTDPTADPNFYTSTVDAATGVNTVTVNATAVLPTTFMSVANINSVTVSSTGEATRRMVDLSLVLDVSSSIGPQWSAVRDAARTFVNSFDAAHDRLALLTFSDGANVINPMPSSRGFDKTGMISNVPSTLPGGSTAMVEGLYRAWDELRSVPTGSQSGLRVIVLFTDGASNSVPGDYGTGPGVGLRTYDFPQNAGDTHGQTWNSPHITGLYDRQTGANSMGVDTTVPWDSPNTPFDANNAWPRYLPLASAHTHHRSAGIPTSFPLQTSSLNVDGVPQSSTRGLRDFDTVAAKYPAEVHNVNNAARNLVEETPRGAKRHRRLQDSHLHDRHGAARAAAAGHEAGVVGEHPQADGERQQLTGLQQQPARRQVLLRADSGRRGPCVRGPSEPDSSVDQVTRHTNRS
jgi:Mg-chelatase subunit ChlD